MTEKSKWQFRSLPQLGEWLVQPTIPLSMSLHRHARFCARFGPGPGPVLFDRICHNNDTKHHLTGPYSPTTTGKWSDSTGPIGTSSWPTGARR